MRWLALYGTPSSKQHMLHITLSLFCYPSFTAFFWKMIQALLLCLFSQCSFLVFFSLCLSSNTWNWGQESLQSIASIFLVEIYTFLSTQERLWLTSYLTSILRTWKASCSATKISMRFISSLTLLHLHMLKLVP